MLKKLLKGLIKFLSISLHNIFLTIVIGSIGLSTLISWATGTLDILIQTIKFPIPLVSEVDANAPCIVSGSATYFFGEDSTSDQYSDGVTKDFHCAADDAPGFTFGIVTIGIAIIASIFVARKKKK